MEGLALRNPGNLPQGNGANSIRLQQQAWEMWIGRFLDLRPLTPAEVFYICRQSLFVAKNVRRPTRSTRGTCASCASGRSRSPTRHAPTPIPAALRRRIQAGPHSLWRYSDFLPVQAPPRGTLPAGWTPLLRADRLAEQLGLREVWVKNDAANPTHSFKDRVVSVALARARELGFQTVACASTGNLANAVAAHAAAAGLESYVFIPSDLEEQKVLATGVYGTNLVVGPRQLRRRQPPVHRALGRARLGVREHQHAAVLLAGVEDACVRDGRAARLRAARPRRLPDRVGLAVHEDRARFRGVDRGRPADGRAADVPRRPGRRCSPVATAFEAGQDFCRPVKPDTIAKSLAIGNPADGPYALDLARRTGGSIEAVTDDEIREGIKLLARTTGSSPRPPAGSRSRCWPSSPRGARSIPASGSSPTSPARG